MSLRRIQASPRSIVMLAAIAAACGFGAHAAAPKPADPEQWVAGGYRDVALLAFGTGEALRENRNPLTLQCGTGDAGVMLALKGPRVAGRATIRIRDGRGTLRLAGRIVAASDPGGDGRFITSLDRRRMERLVTGGGSLSIRVENATLSISRVGLRAHAAPFLALCRDLKRRGDRLKNDL